MIDHTGLTVSDIDKAKAFYTQALGPLGYELVMQWEQSAGFGAGSKPDFWIAQGTPNAPRIHVAFTAAASLLTPSKRDLRADSSNEICFAAMRGCSLPG